MENSPEKSKKQELCTVLLSLWLILTSVGGIILYILGIAQHQSLFKQIALIGFSAFFVTAGWYYAVKHHKISILLFVISIFLLLTVFFF